MVYVNTCARARTHTHMQAYEIIIIYVCVCVCVCVYIAHLRQQCHNTTVPQHDSATTQQCHNTTVPQHKIDDFSGAAFKGFKVL